MLKTEVKRRGEFTPIPKYIRKQVTRPNCSICYQPYNRVYTEEHNVVRYPKQVLHHLIPRRWLAEHGIEAHHVTGLVSMCNYCHGKFKVAEDRLYQGDLIGFLMGNKRAGIDPKRIQRFALSVGLTEFQGVNV